MSPERGLGVTGVAVEDTIEMPDETRTEDWGGIYYTVYTLAAIVPPGTRIVPILAVGEDAFASVRDDFAKLPAVDVEGLVPVDAVNNKVHLRYAGDGSRTETLTGGVPPLPWEALERWPAQLDAWLWNMVSGMEVERETFLTLKSAFEGVIHFDVHSLSLEHAHDGPRVHRVPHRWEEWVAGTTWVQLNETEAGLLWNGTAEPIAPQDEPRLAARIHALGPEGVLVTRGELGAAYHGASGETLRLGSDAPTAPVDPTGCGDVFGAAWFALRTACGLPARPAFAGAVRAAGVAATLRGTRGLYERLRGQPSEEETETTEASDG